MLTGRLLILCEMKTLTMEWNNVLFGICVYILSCISAAVGQESKYLLSVYIVLALKYRFLNRPSLYLRSLAHSRYDTIWISSKYLGDEEDVQYDISAVWQYPTLAP